MARKSGIGTLLSFDLERAGPTPLFQQLYRQLRQAVLEGRLRPGVRLPATRFLARELGLSRNTVLTAYDQLASEGFLELRHRSGVFVAEDLPIAEPVAVATPPTPAPRIGKRGQATIGSRPVTDPRVAPGAAPDAKRWPGCFASALPDVSSFPFDLWARLLARHWRRPSAQLPVGGDAGGHPDLRAAIAHYVGEARGIACDPDHVLVVSGIRQALDLTCRLLLDPGDAAWMENPGHPGPARRAGGQRPAGRIGAGRWRRDRHRGRPAHGAAGAARVRRAIASISARRRAVAAAAADAAGLGARGGSLGAGG